jgi:O-antigen/teichoic acid export membrane protein
VLQLANLNLGSSLLHYVAKFEAQGNRTASVTYFETAVVATTGLAVVVVAIGYSPCVYFVHRWLPPENAREVHGLLPFVFAISFMMTLSAIPLAALGAFGRSFLRSTINIFAGILNAILACALTSSLGVTAIAWALLTQSIIVLVLGLAAVMHFVPEVHLIPRRFDYVAARRMARYGASLQAMSLCLFMLEPFTRLLIGRYGSLSDVTYFAVAWRLILTVRSLVYNSALTLVPAFSAMSAGSREQRDGFYNRLNSVVHALASPCMAAAACAAPWVSVMMFGEDSPEFRTFCIVLAAAAVMDLIAAGPYLRALGEGQMKWNMLAHVSYVIVNGAIGLLLAMQWGALGATVAISIATGLGALILIVGNHRAFGGRAIDFVKVSDLFVMGASIVACAVTFGIYSSLGPSFGLVPVFFVAATIAGTIVGLAIWLHPSRALLLRVLRREEPGMSLPEKSSTDQH